MVEGMTEGCMAWIRRTTVLLDASKNLVTTAAECAATCIPASKCNAWQWCDDAAGCTSEFGKKLLPKGGCQVEEQKLAPGEPLFNWNPSQFSAGYNGGVGPILRPFTPAHLQVAIHINCPVYFCVRFRVNCALAHHFSMQLPIEPRSCPKWHISKQQ